jgi:hypothetical protein
MGRACKSLGITFNQFIDQAITYAIATSLNREATSSIFERVEEKLV